MRKCKTAYIGKKDRQVKQIFKFDTLDLIIRGSFEENNVIIIGMCLIMLIYKKRN